METIADRFSPVPGVRSMINDDGGVLMNVDSGLVYSLSVVGAHIWHRIEQHRFGLTFVELFESLRNDFEVGDEQLQSDLRTFIAELKKKGLLTNATAVTVVEPCAGPEDRLTLGFPNISPDTLQVPTEPGENRQPSRIETLMALLGLAAVDVVLKVGGFRSLYRMVKRYPVAPKRRGAGGTISRIGSAVDRACIFYFKQALCLQRSALTTCLLRKQGIPAEMVIGCRKMPFHGHAWVEVNGEVVNDRKKVKDYYGVLDRC